MKLSKHSIIKIRRKKELVALCGGKCVMCGLRDHYSVYDFHHTGKKNAQISQILSRRSWEVILKEVENCIMVCSNCHRKIHSLTEIKIKNIKNIKTGIVGRPKKEESDKKKSICITLDHQIHKVFKDKRIKLSTYINIILNKQIFGDEE